MTEYGSITIDLDESSLRRQLDQWKRNLAFYEEQRAQVGMLTDVSLVNAIAQARQEIERIELSLVRLATGEPQRIGISAGYNSLIELYASIADDQRRLWTIVQGNREWLEKVHRKVYPTQRRVVSRTVSIGILGVYLYAVSWFQIREFLAANMTSAIILTVGLMMLSYLIWWLGGND